jgi:hypothetical protein
MYITRLATKEIFTPSNKILREVGRAKDLSAPRYWNINDFKKGYQTTRNVIKNEKGDMVTDCQSILVRCRDHLSQLFNVRGLMMLGRYKYIQQNH